MRYSTSVTTLAVALIFRATCALGYSDYYEAREYADSDLETRFYKKLPSDYAARSYEDGLHDAREEIISMLAARFGESEDNYVRDIDESELEARLFDNLCATRGRSHGAQPKKSKGKGGAKGKPKSRKPKKGKKKGTENETIPADEAP